jgi:hypothetical protein
MPPSGFCILASTQTFTAGRFDTARSVPGDRRGAAGGPTSESLTALCVPSEHALGPNVLPVSHVGLRDRQRVAAKFEGARLIRP